MTLRFNASSATSRTTKVSSSNTLFRALKIAALAGVLPLTATARQAIPQVSVPAPGSYNRAMVVPFTVQFSQPVLVNGTPRLALNVGGATRYATLVSSLSPTASTSVAFEYVPDANDSDADGIAVANTVDLNGGTITTTDSIPVALTFATPDTRMVTIATARPPTPRIASAVRSGKADKVVLQGTADGGSMVMVTRADVGLVGVTIAAANGAWSFEASAAQVGSVQFSAAIENSEGLVSENSASVSVGQSAGE